MTPLSEIGRKIEQERAEAGARYLLEQYEKLTRGLQQQHLDWLAKPGVTLVTARKRAKRFAEYEPEKGAVVFKKPAGGYDAYYGDRVYNSCEIIERVPAAA